MCAGIVLIVIGGNLFSGSLEIVAHLFADSQMRQSRDAMLRAGFKLKDESFADFFVGRNPV